MSQQPGLKLSLSSAREATTSESRKRAAYSGSGSAPEHVKSPSSCSPVS